MQITLFGTKIVSVRPDRARMEEYRQFLKLASAECQQCRMQRLSEKTKRNTEFCRELAYDIIKISELAAEYRENMNALVPKKEYRQWLALFLSGNH